MICVYGCTDAVVLIVCIRLIFGSTTWPNTNSAFSPLFGAKQNTNRILGTALHYSIMGLQPQSYQQLAAIAFWWPLREMFEDLKPQAKCM